MKKLVLAISLVIASSVNVYSQNDLNAQDFPIASISINRYLQAKNMDICLYSKIGNHDNDTEFYKIAKDFLIDSNVRAKFANHKDIGRLIAGTIKKDNLVTEIVLFRDYIKNKNWYSNVDHTKDVVFIGEWSELGVASIITQMYDSTGNVLCALSFEFSFNPSKKLNLKNTKMNLDAIQVFY